MMRPWSKVSAESVGRQVHPYQLTLIRYVITVMHRRGSAVRPYGLTMYGLVSFLGFDRSVGQGEIGQAGRWRGQGEKSIRGLGAVHQDMRAGWCVAPCDRGLVGLRGLLSSSNLSDYVWRAFEL
jgi:hypothetical protein